ncbi:PaaI family thioesterase [Alkalilacustris brevis]|uniref:PaaI family thioesterase n=1 Tax=Alkalilacustris brevis TaxID=2026338 RepID=UPI000E0D4C1A|nr:PaaI family thioesterase [Alkalilacustris brevis]
MNDQPDLEEIARDQPPFARFLGMRVVSFDTECVVAEMEVSDVLANRNGVLHGGAIMALADNLGGTATFLNIRPDQGTTTLESKTNFFRPVPIGETLRAEARALHKGRRTMVWQTVLTRSDGKVAAIVTQTQMVLEQGGG